MDSSVQPFSNLTPTPAEKWASGIINLIEKFLGAQDLKEISREGYRRRLRYFLEWCMKNSVSQPVRETILNYKRHLQGREFTSCSINSYLVAVRAYFKWTENERLYPNIAKNIKGASRQRGFRKDPLTLDQVHELLGSIDRKTLKGKRDFALLNLMVRTGPRSIEIIRSNVEDLRQESGGESVLWLQGKGAEEKDAFVVITKSSLDPIMDYFSCRGVLSGSDPLFGSTSDGNLHQRMTTRSIRRIVKERLRAIKINSPRLSCHSLRHTTVTLLLKAGGSVFEAQQLARHNDLSTTAIYSHAIDRALGIPEKKLDALLDGVSGPIEPDRSS